MGRLSSGWSGQKKFGQGSVVKWAWEEKEEEEERILLQSYLIPAATACFFFTLDYMTDIQENKHKKKAKFIPNKKRKNGLILQ